MRISWLKHFGAVVLAAALTAGALARIPHGGPSSGGSNIVNYVGANLNPPDYYDTALPCLNLLDCASNNMAPASGVSVWQTSPAEASSNGHGGVDSAIALDVNGYPISLTPTSVLGVTSGAAYTSINALMNSSLQAYGGTYAPGQTAYYPATQYTLLCSGADYSITMSGNAASYSGGGLSLTCSHTAPASLVFQVTSPSQTGMTMKITSIGTVIPGSISLAIVPTAYVSNWQAGEYFNPATIKSIITTEGYSRIRFMEWSQMWNIQKMIVCSGDLPTGSTSCSLNSSNEAFPEGWDLPTGTYTVMFLSGDIRTISATWHSATITWTGGTTADNPYTQPYNAQAFMPQIQSWANRAPKNYLGWGGCKGVPIEIQFALVSEMNLDWWLNTFLASTTPVMSDYGTNGANYYNTQEATLVASLIAATPSWTGKIYIEVSNEVWNYSSTQTYYFAAYYGLKLLPGGSICTTSHPDVCGQEFLGVATSQVADTWVSVLGSSLFNSRIVVSMGSQTASGNGSNYLIDSMTAPDWVALGGGNTAPYTHAIKSMHYAPYFGSTPKLGSYELNNAGTANPVNLTVSTWSPGPGSSGATGVTLTAATGASFGGYPETFLITCSDNEVRSVTLSASGSTLTWTGALSGSGLSTTLVAGDVAAILAQSDPLTTFFNLMYSNSYNGITYPGTRSNGFIGYPISQMNTILSALSGQSWYSGLALEFYETGPSFNMSNKLSAGSYLNSMTALMAQMDRDPRMAYMMHDPGHVFSSNNGYLDSLLVLTPHTGNIHYGDAYPINTQGEWGIYESAMQPIGGSTAPPKAQAVAAFTH